METGETIIDVIETSQICQNHRLWHTKMRSYWPALTPTWPYLSSKWCVIVVILFNLLRLVFVPLTAGDVLLFLLWSPNERKVSEKERERER